MKKIDLEPVLMSYLSWPLNKNIDQWLPVYYLLPTGTKKKIRYKQGHGAYFVCTNAGNVWSTSVASDSTGKKKIAGGIAFTRAAPITNNKRFG